MKLLYPGTHKKAFSLISLLKKTVVVFSLVSASLTSLQAQSTTVSELVFQNSSLVLGTAGQDGAVYRFPTVSTGIDALVKINGRSSSLVQLLNLDLTTTGFNKAFQPQITYNSNNAPGAADWWMEFQISFVQANTNTSISVNNYDLTALDIDGNDDKVNEYDNLYGLNSFVTEVNTLLTSSNLVDNVLGLLTNVGKRFDGPLTNFPGIDTAATSLMTTSHYSNTNSFKVRTGGRSTGASVGTDRMYSFWFKSFTYQAGVQSTLPATLINWTAGYGNNNVSLKWTTTVERNASHFIIERSFDGIEYSDAAMIIAAGNSDVPKNYAFADKIPSGNTGVIYYRLMEVDMDGRSKYSDIRIVRVGKTNDAVKILAYPNPVVSDVRVTVPQNWQDKTVTYQVVNTSGQVLKSITTDHASQTQVVPMNQVPTGIYIVKVTKGNETTSQTIIKSTN